MTERVADRLTETIFHLKEMTEKSGYPPFTEPPEPETRYALYMIRSNEEWRLIAQTDPDRALEEIRDWANMARRRGEPEVVEEAARLILAEFAVQDMGTRND